MTPPQATIVAVDGPTTYRSDEQAEAEAYLAEQIRIAIEKGLRADSIIDHLEKASAPIPPEEVRAIVAWRYAEAEADENHRQAENAKISAQAMAELSELPNAATDLLTHGDPIAYHRAVFATLHSGDQEIGDVWLMAGMTQAAVTTMGIQPGFSGRKGAGKSSGTRTALHLHPQEYVVDGSFSNKGLLYDNQIQPGTIFYSDDTYLPPDTASMIKRAMTGFQTGIEHRTVNKVGGANVSQRLTIPPRCLFAFSAVYDTGDDELRDRQYLISLAPTDKDDVAWLDFVKDRLATGREEFPVTREVLVCREMIRQVKCHTFRVRVPFADRIVFSTPGAKRDILMFFDFLQGSTVLHYRQREHETGDDGIITVDATEADFANAQAIFRASEQTRTFKLSKDERALLAWLGEHSFADEGIEETRVVREYGPAKKLDRGAIRRLLYGRDGDGGIVNKVPGVDKVLETRSTAGGRSQKNVIYVIGSTALTLSEFETFVALRPTAGDPDDRGRIQG